MAEQAAAHRQHLIRVAFRIVGSLTDAEDAVQEAFERWYRLPVADRRDVRNSAAWLTTVVSRICLDLLGSAAHRREEYVGPWLPEPIPGTGPLVSDDDPVDQAIMRESVSTAMLRLMEHMTPAERVAFVLHDVFHYSFTEVGSVLDRSAGAARELASSGRRRLSGGKRADVDAARNREVVEAFLIAAGTGELAALVRLLDPRVVLTSDGGGIARAALNPIYGSDKVARFVLGVRRRNPGVRVTLGETADGAAILFSDEAGVSGVLNFEVVDGAVSQIWIQWNPRKLGLWKAPA
ncbi:RNA polymerase sigma factor SigJ [Agromyces subbeticus]|uniref:RNA polymerase sigma factor SigJ n=1 Tax=Agromyces subbeticus TaxID=293890 RepID=UPI0003B3A372|nr:RNA polymerase sigma factor SigJ [Agromyces subbeticus]